MKKKNPTLISATIVLILFCISLTVGYIDVLFLKNSLAVWNYPALLILTTGAFAFFVYAGIKGH